MKNPRKLILGTGAVVIVVGIALYLSGWQFVGLCLAALGAADVLVASMFSRRLSSVPGEAPDMKHETAHRAVDVAIVLGGFFLVYWTENWFFLGYSMGGPVAFLVRNRPQPLAG
ncbi:hypothetical protein [Austwickia chelonae]|uniref:hypothetical protein n=1 Tax=Austwickia chelonae TaxID=100225 RepID=UPI0013C2B0A2|nr:hypothetical protein [Austwickia chelonae]